MISRTLLPAASWLSDCSGVFLTTLLLATAVAAQPQQAQSAPEKQAVAVLMPVGDSGVHGVVHFIQDGRQVKIQGKVTGLTPGKHGFHVHQFGDLTDAKAGESAGPHYAPRGMPHGRPTDEKRHVGDLGNIVANEQGEATISMEDSGIQLHGPHSVIGRALVVHAEADKFTQPQGDAGPRAAFGVIGIAKPH